MQEKFKLLKIKKLLIFAALLFATATCDAGPLWFGGNDIYSNRGTREYKSGDIVTILIAEQSNAQTRATSSAKKESAIDAKPAPNIPIIKNVMNKFVGKTESTSEFDGQGSTTRSGTLTGTVSATVLEVMDNGNLLIEGVRSIRVNNETQVMRVRGVARTRDIDATNTINSKLLANAEIKFDGQGEVSRVNRSGILTKIFNTIF